MADNQNPNLKPCKHCGQMMAKSAKVCPNCGGKNKPPFFKRPWFIILCVLIVLGIIGSAGGGSKSSNSGGSSSGTTNTEKVEEKIEYTHYDVTEMMDDLDGNAMKAQNKYKGQYIEITGRLNVVDSDGKYISLTKADDEWAILGVTCYIKNDDQKNKVMEMSIGDTVTLRGKCTDVGEVLGYYLDIAEID
ncbi:tRNA_anti-like [Butyrivibrio sp. INlla18]|uniref:OB-fold protein n=1 Tax=Butyrivibrio sp. INlla18 TaxID=1520806 RepID=UPI00088E69C9|nr:hypothetical protein [Butyrivibrio sp. INlla18]SDA79860.1 tRNA_anti-like [Butyrivibrio sp. INlla18]